MLATHVNDCVITGTSKDLIADYKYRLDAVFSLTDLGGIHWLLGIKVILLRAKDPKVRRARVL